MVNATRLKPLLIPNRLITSSKRGVKSQSLLFSPLHCTSSSSSFSSTCSYLSSRKDLPPKPLPAPTIPNPTSSSVHNSQLRKASFNESDLSEFNSISNQVTSLIELRTNLGHKQNGVGKRIRELKGSKTTNENKTEENSLESLQLESSSLREESRLLNFQIKRLQDKLEVIKSKIPNLTHPTTPIGSEQFAKVIKVWSPNLGRSVPIPRQLPSLSSLPITLSDFPESPPSDSSKDHLSIASSMKGSSVLSNLGLSPLSFRQASLTSGPGLLYLLPPLTNLSTCLIQFALKTSLKHDFQLIAVPDLIKAEVAKRCGFEPRGESSQTFFVETERDRRKQAVLNENEKELSEKDGLCLIGTAEIPLVSLLANQTIGEKEFEPIKLVAHSHAYRAEAGARGKESKGLYRVHQFDKVELVVVCQNSKDPTQESQMESHSDRILEELREIQESIVESLGLNYRVLDMPTEELGASAYKKYDIEVWMPGRGNWGEVSSASNCTDFQSRRLHIKHKSDSSSKSIFAHTLNATAAAIPRLIVAILENHGLTRDGRLRLPSCLKEDWMGKMEEVEWFEVASTQDTNVGEVGSDKREYSTMAAKTVSKARRVGNQSRITLLLSSAPILKRPPISGKRRFSSSSPVSNSSSNPSSTSSPSTPSSTSSSSSPHPNPSKSTPLSKAISKLRELSLKTGTDPASLIFSFLILHEITAFLPLVLLFWLFNAFGVGIMVLQWVYKISASEEKGEENGLHKMVAGWIDEGMKRAEKYGRRKGYFGFEKESKKEVEEKVGEGDGDETKGIEAVKEKLDAKRLAGGLADAVSAYVLVKALIPARIAVSISMAPAFSRTVIEPVKRVVMKIRSRKS